MSSENVHDISALLADFARESPSQPAVISPTGSLNAQELDEISGRCAIGLRRRGIGPGVKTVLMVTPGVEFTVLTFGLLKAGAIIVVVDPGIGWRNLSLCLGQARPAAFVGVPKAHLGRILFGWGRSTIETNIVVGPWRLPGWVPYSKLINEEIGPQFPKSPDPDATAAIVFTSGSTGTPKGVIYTRRMFGAQARLLQRHFCIQPGEVDLATFPLFALFDPAMRVTSVFPEMDFTKPGRANPAIITETIRRHHVTHMFGSPALLDGLGLYGERERVKLGGVRRVLSAGAPVRSHVLSRISAMIDEGAEIHTPYGATEALPVCSIPGREALAENSVGRGVCVGRPLEGVGLTIIRISDEPITHWSDDLTAPGGQVGEIVVWGDNVSRSYHERPDADRLAKIPGPDGRTRHRMGDLGFLDEKGRVWFCGRKSQRVTTEGGELYTIPCESVFNQHPAVRRTALVGLGGRPRQRPVLCVELADRRRGVDSLRSELVELGQTHPSSRAVRDILFHPGFPVDVRHNAKIFREKLAIWAAARLPGTGGAL